MFRISTDPDALDFELIHDYLSNQSYWARGIGEEVLRRALAHSLCFGGFVGDEQVAFARVATDRATFANLLDVFVLPGHQGRGYGGQLIDAVIAHPDLQGLRRFSLNTRDAHALYARYGFAAATRPETLMEKFSPDIYSRPA